VPLETPTEALLNAGYTEADIDGTWTLYGPGSCDRCKGSGYKGRVGIYQVMPVTEEISRIILAGGNALDIAAQAAREGVKDLRRSGLIKAMQGVTSLDEVLSTTNA
jgi:type IV pilus assembly protein PilB